ncbi:MAG: GNAT family N-acetyltransferase, partial [Ilumatobacteraceae bacterium]
PGLGDATAFWATDPEGFFVGELDGDLVASISIVRYADRRSFLGFYIVRPDQRGRGFGWRLWDFARRQVADAVDGTGLDGVIDQVGAYRRSGFVLAHRNVRYVAPNPAHGTAPASSAAAWGFESFTPADLADLVDYDAGVFGCRRPEFLEAWLAEDGSNALVAREAGRITGYGAIRPATEGYRVNPLFAETSDIAARLLDALLATVPGGEPVAVDVPGVNDDAVRLVTERSMTPAFETARMYAGDVPDTDWRRVFGVT